MSNEKSTIEKIRDLIHSDPIINSSFKVHYLDEDEAVRVALLTYVAQHESILLYLSRLIRNQPPAPFQLDIKSMSLEEQDRLFSTISRMMSQDQREAILRKHGKL